MIAQKKYCRIVLANSQLLGDLVKNVGNTMKLQSIELGLKRENASIRKSMAFIKTLKDAGYTEEDIFETEKA